MKKIGAITVGQAPRWDISKDVIETLGEGFEIVEAGIWDGVSREQIERDYGPENGKDVLPTRLADGSTVSCAEYHCFPRIRKCVERLEAQGVELIYMYCLGSFPDIKANVPLIYPRNISINIVQSLLVNSNMIELMPSGEIYDQQKRFWSQYVKDITLLVANPHDDKVIWGQLDEAAVEANKNDKVDLVLMDCMGYNVEHMRYLKKRTNKLVLLPRTAVAAIIRELLREN